MQLTQQPAVRVSSRTGLSGSVLDSGRSGQAGIRCRGNLLHWNRHCLLDGGEPAWKETVSTLYALRVVARQTPAWCLLSAALVPFAMSSSTFLQVGLLCISRWACPASLNRTRMCSSTCSLLALLSWLQEASLSAFFKAVHPVVCRHQMWGGGHI